MPQSVRRAGFRQRPAADGDGDNTVTSANRPPPMKQVIVVFERPDIAAVLQLRSHIAEAEVWVFDPHLLDNLHDIGITDARYIDIRLQVDMPSYIAQVQARALATALQVEAGLHRLVPESAGCHWQHLNYYHLTSTLLQYELLWDRFLQGVTETTFHVPVRDIAATFYAHSFLPSVLLLERLNTHGIPFSAITHSRVDSIPQMIPARLAAQTGDYDLFVHLPTCIYDRDYYADELAASGLRPLNFASQNWNVPFPDMDTAELVDTEVALADLSEPQRQTIEAVLPELTKELEGYFSGHIRTASFAERQAAHLASQYQAQLTFFFHLTNRFSRNPPKKLVLSNHDSGLHGPLISFARAHNVAILFLPHAKIFNWAIATRYQNVSALFHPMQGGAISDISGRRVSAYPLMFRELQQRSTATAGSLASIGIVLNKFSLDGMVLMNLDHYRDGLRRLLSWCSQYGVRALLRSKPGGSCIRWLAAELGMDIETLNLGMAGTLADFAQGCDLCIMYDAATSGAIDLLRLSVPTLNTVFRAMSGEETSIVHDHLVPTLSVPATLEKLDCFRKDPTHLAIFRNEQFAGYIGRFGRALPLRAYL